MVYSLSAIEESINKGAPNTPGKSHSIDSVYVQVGMSYKTDKVLTGFSKGKGLVMYRNLNIKQHLLMIIRGEINYLHSLKEGEGTEIMFPVLCEPFEDNPEYIVYYIDLFHLSADPLAKEILATVISEVCNYGPVIEFLTSKPVAPWSKSAFDEEVPLSEAELQRLLSLPEGQRMSYDPADEIVVQKRFAAIRGKTLKEIERMFSNSTDD